MEAVKLNETFLNFEKTGYVEKELIDRISLWMLRILFRLGAHRNFIEKEHGIKEDDIANFLDVGSYIDQENVVRSEVIGKLKEKYLKLERQQQFSTSKRLQSNLSKLSNLMGLNHYEVQILEFTVLLKQYDILDRTADLLGNNLTTQQVKYAYSVILNIPIKEVAEAFGTDSKFTRSSLITFWNHAHTNLNSKIDVISDSFIEKLMNFDEEILEMIKDLVRPCESSRLSLDDYAHIRQDRDIVTTYLTQAHQSKTKGVNVLFYGPPGTGKTELAKALSDRLSTKLYEISYADEEEEPISGDRRLRAYKTAQAFLSNVDTLLMFDEAEDVFDQNDSPFMTKKQKNKAWLNRILENNTIPTIWITNNVNSIDNAMIRRFDLAIEVPIPHKRKRAEIIKSHSCEMLNEKEIRLLSEHEHIAPAVITRAVKVTQATGLSKSGKVLIHVVNNTIRAQGFEKVNPVVVNALPGFYDPTYINTDVDLEKLTHGIEKHPNARLCLYGPAGTGKSAFGRYIADRLHKPMLLKKGSDLMSMWVGGTEKNIARAFEEAKEEEAVLVFDEVDSFLTDRTQANQSWEATQVNEMLVQMESFEGIFIATTNLMEKLDKASLRRFDLKMSFDFLSPKQSVRMFHSCCKELKLDKPSKDLKRSVEQLQHLTPGDFSAVVRQNRFRPIESADDLIHRLAEEVSVKEISDGKVMGFLS